MAREVWNIDEALMLLPPFDLRSVGRVLQGSVTQWTSLSCVNMLGAPSASEVRLSVLGAGDPWE